MENMFLFKDVFRTAQNKQWSRRKKRSIEAAILTPIIRYPCRAPGNALKIPCPREGMLSKNVAIREQAQKANTPTTSTFTQSATEFLSKDLCFLCPVDNHHVSSLSEPANAGNALK
ncbi:hypothetical protein HOLleu_03613 [Holothuria leucospilota]|uniref:Uncharacterized protein n=1 Tax=Holothuria leucospilota TaxID=206669 RepID=A0A9Q1HKB8_HOLLE|nr:hypothetical protein HOLleu_03613 [Holothuria leucospilota]